MDLLGNDYELHCRAGTHVAAKLLKSTAPVLLVSSRYILHFYMVIYTEYKCLPNLM
jgi:hypothetical protein